MASDATNREVCRDQLATLLNTTIVVADGKAQAVYNHKRGKFSESPVILVFAAGSQRPQLGQNAQKHRNTFVFTVDVWVADADESSGWTEQEVDDKLDELDKAIADVVADNRAVDGVWDYAEYNPDTPSQILEVTTKAGQNYILERSRVVITAFE